MDDGIAMVITYFTLTAVVIVGLIVTLVFDGGGEFLIAGLFLLFLILGVAALMTLCEHYSIFDLLMS